MRVPALCAVACCLFAFEASAEVWPLFVIGEVWLVNTSEFWPLWGQKSKTLTDIDTVDGQAFCFLTGVGGKFAGGGEWGVVERKGSVWRFRGNAYQMSTRFNVQCWRSRFASEPSAKVPMVSVVNTWEFWPYQSSDVYTQTLTDIDTVDGQAFCFLTGVGGKFAGGGEWGVVERKGSVWRFRGNAYQWTTRFNVECWRKRRFASGEASAMVVNTWEFWPYQSSDVYTQTLTDIDTVEYGRAFCFLTGVGGKFAGGGEWGVVERKGSVWRFRGNAYQWTTRFNVECWRNRQ